MTPDDIKLHLEELYSYARPRIVNQLELDDVLTDTFTNALKAEGWTTESHKHDSAWLIGILRKQIVAHYRKKYQSEEAIANARSITKETLERPFELPEQLSNVDAELIGHSDGPSFWSAFNQCIEMLNPVHAEAFVLRDLEDVSVEEVCGIFGLRRGDVLELIYRARMMVIACLVKNLESG